MLTYFERLGQLSIEGSLLRFFLAFLYALLFLLTLHLFVRRPKARNFFTVALGIIFLSLAIIFFNDIFVMASADYSRIQWVGVILAILPAILFMYFRKHFTGAEESIASLEHFNQLKDEFLSVASHELRTPLSVINGFAEILVREKLGNLNDEQKRRIRKILMQAQRLNRIVDELLDLSRIRSGKVQIRRDVFDLVPVLKACLDDHQVVCDQQSIQLIDEISDVLPDIIGDIERMTQVIVNLLNNAIKYTEQGGRVTLSASYRKAKHEIYIEIKDSGIGIDPAEQPKVFDEFYRCQHQYARRFSGSGLGLSIVKQLIEVHGGTVGVYSEGIGKGSTFFFTLKPAPKQGKEQLKSTPTSQSHSIPAPITEKSNPHAA